MESQFGKGPGGPAGPPAAGSRQISTYSASWAVEIVMMVTASDGVAPSCRVHCYAHHTNCVCKCPLHTSSNSSSRCGTTTVHLLLTRTCCCLYGMHAAVPVVCYWLLQHSISCWYAMLQLQGTSVMTCMYGRRGTQLLCQRMVNCKGQCAMNRLCVGQMQYV
jgi:hypothetical protein